MENRALLQSMQKVSKFNTTAIKILRLFSMPIPIASIVMGGLHLHDCPVKPYIPVYLLVLGSICLATVIPTLLPCALQPQPDDGSLKTLDRVCTTWNSLVYLFLFCWYLTGSVWIYSIYQPSYIPGTSDYCAKSLYLFAFWITTILYIAIALALLVLCCAVPLFCAIQSNATDDV